MGNKKQLNGNITPVSYRPPADYGLDMEILPLSALKRRASANYLHTPRRLEFHLLVCVTDGYCTHTADFESIACEPGSLLILRPGQIHRFDPTNDCQGWLIIFRPEFLQPRETTAAIDEWELLPPLDEIRIPLTLNDAELQAVTEIIMRMFHDAQIKADTSVRHALLRSQLNALLIRIRFIQTRCNGTEKPAPVVLRRFKRYRLAVEKWFDQWHHVAEYANLLGCSEKSLSRAALKLTGVNAKTYLSQRIALEAKRLLAHTGLPIKTIAHELGFDETTNFVKFFRREAGCSPGDFRKLHIKR